MMIFSLVGMTGLEKCCITSAYLQLLCHSGERPVARGPLVLFSLPKWNLNYEDLQFKVCMYVMRKSGMRPSVT